MVRARRQLHESDRMMQLAAASGEIVVKGAPILLAVEACGKGVMRPVENALVAGR